MPKQLTTQQLAQALDIRKRIESIDRQRDKLADQLDKALSGGRATARRGRKSRKSRARRVAAPKKRAGAAGRVRKDSTKSMIIDVLRNSKRALSIPEILDRLKARGYTSKSSNPVKNLGVVLYRDKTFTKPARGVFSVRGSGARKGSGTKKKTRKASAGRRLRSKQTLRDATIQALKSSGKPMKVADIESAVRSGGYKTRAKNLTQQLSKVLSDNKTFKKVKRGIYSFKS